jgi:hypothetical protein
VFSHIYVGDIKFVLNSLLNAEDSQGGATKKNVGWC